MLFYEIKDAVNKRKGLFASKDIKKDELLFHIDLNKLKSYTLNEITRDSHLSQMADHADYVGKGK